MKLRKSCIGLMGHWYICGVFFDVDGKCRDQRKIEMAMEDPLFWHDQSVAKQVLSEYKVLNEWTKPMVKLRERVDVLKEFIQEMGSDGDLCKAMLVELGEIESILRQFNVKKALDGEFDRNSCYLSINAGAGGTESCDWAQMLLRMYQRWATKRKWRVSLIHKCDGDVAGIKQATLHVVGEFAYGYCRSERGVHRLVRISPFDGRRRRHTSFAAVEVLPEIDEDVDIDIDPDDLRIDTYRSSGAGGQHVNTTDSAVRVTHLPSGVVVSCQGERSQVQNKETCMKMLRTKLHDLKSQERAKKIEELVGEKKKNEWSSQKRSYVLFPYELVRDEDSGYQETNPRAVLDGELDGFVSAALGM